VLPDAEPAAEAGRELAHGSEVRSAHGRRITWNVALDPEVSEAPWATSSDPDGSAMRAVDGDAATAWRGARGESVWAWTLPFRRIVHLGLLRAHFGDSPARGVPSEYRWEAQFPIDGRCQPWSLWETLPGGDRRDREGNTFLYGPKDVHAQKQALFTDVDACGLRIVVTAVDGPVPVLREVKILESARSVLSVPDVVVAASPTGDALPGTSAVGAVDGTYERVWMGVEGSGPWTLELRLPERRFVDRLRLLLGDESAMVDRRDGPGRTLMGARMPTAYRVLTSPDGAPGSFVSIAEAAPPTRNGRALPVRRRLIRFNPRPVRVVRIEIDAATDANGATGTEQSAPVVREVGLYDADDPRPAVTEPLFLSVNANPAGLLDRMRGGERTADARVGRDVHHRLRRIVAGVDSDTAWHTDDRRARDSSAGRFLQVIEGDDPSLSLELLEAISPPPIVLLSGSFDWEFDDATTAPRTPLGRWTWDPTARADEPDRGMGQLREAVRGRVAPFIGFCGGAQILSLLEAPSLPEGDSQFDAILVRNDNQPIRGQRDDERHHERAWWSDFHGTDGERPRVHFIPHDPLFATGDPGFSREVTEELPVSHGDMIRMSAFGGPLRRFEVVAWSRLCGPWVEEHGPETTWPDLDDPRSRCVVVPQAFRSRDVRGYPLVGFQFHPEQRDLQRLAPGSPPEARGDALNMVANAIDLALDAYVERYWPEM
jgi:hypothetical protein